MNTNYYAPQMPQSMPPAAPTQKKKLSGIAVFSMIFAIIFAIAAACMAFLPVLDIKITDKANSANTMHTTANMLEYTYFGDFGKFDDKEFTEKTASAKINRYGTGFDQDFYAKFLVNSAADFYNFNAKDNESKYTTQGSMFILFTTILFFTMFGVALFVLIGKLFCSKGFGRSLALIFSIIGFLCTGGYFVWLMLIISKAVKSPYLAVAIFTISPGIGIILMTAFALLTMIFCCMAASKNSVFKKASNKPQPMAYYNGVPADQNAQNMVNPVSNPYGTAQLNPQMNVPATNYGVQQQTFTPPAAPVPQQSYAPVQDVPPQPVSATEDTISFDPPVVAPAPAPAQASYQPEQPAPAPVPAAKSGQIEGLSGDYSGVVIDIADGDKLVIGTDPSCSNIVLPAEMADIAKSHCSVAFDSDIDSYKVTDTSETGTFFNGQRLPANRGIYLPRGTVLALGSGAVTFRLK